MSSSHQTLQDLLLGPDWQHHGFTVGFCGCQCCWLQPQPNPGSPLTATEHPRTGSPAFLGAGGSQIHGQNNFLGLAEWRPPPLHLAEDAVLGSATVSPNVPFQVTSLHFLFAKGFEIHQQKGHGRGE